MIVEVYVKAIQKLLGDNQPFSVSGTDYSSLELFGDGTKPTESAITTKYNEIIFDHKLEELRNKRNKLLKETDHLALSDQTLSAAMTTYRQNLRDITDNLTTVSEIDAVTFPTKPTE